MRLKRCSPSGCRYKCEKLPVLYIDEDINSKWQVFGETVEKPFGYDTLMAATEAPQVKYE